MALCHQPKPALLWKQRPISAKHTKKWFNSQWKEERTPARRPMGVWFLRPWIIHGQYCYMEVLTSIIDWSYIFVDLCCLETLRYPSMPSHWIISPVNVLRWTLHHGPGWTTCALGAHSFWQALAGFGASPLHPLLQWPHSTGTRWAQGWRESVTAGCPGLLQSEPTLFKELPCSEMKRVYPEVIQHWLIMSTLRTETVRKHEREEETPSLGTLNPNSHQVTVSSGVSRHCTVPTSYYHLGPPSCTQKPKVVLQGARPQTLRF